VLGGDIRRRDTIPALTADQNAGDNAKHIMGWYERHYDDRPELGVLRLMGLFDRPAGAGAIAALRADPPIAGLTDALAGPSDADWGFALSNLRKAGLLAPADKNKPGRLDCHPLVREHFGERLRTADPKAWRKAQSRLYEYYRGLPDKDEPDTLEGLEPLYRAVAHGCMAGRYRDALDEVLWRRIWRLNDYFSGNKLGAIGADLAALAGFFVKRWSLVVGVLPESDKAILAHNAGTALRALGRLCEAAEALETGLAAALGRRDWGEAAVSANNLSEVHLAMGNVAAAIDFARRSVEYADRSGDLFQRMSKRTTLADALHQAGQTNEAAQLFEAAEEMQRGFQPEHPLLYSMQGYRYFDFLLARGTRQMLRRAQETSEWMLQDPRVPILTVALGRLSLGRALTPCAKAEGGEDLSAAAKHLNATVQGMRAAGEQIFIAHALLHRAALHRLRKDWPAAEADLAEVEEIAGRSGMKLHMADHHLESARLALARKNIPAAREHLADAEVLVDETGYRRRDGEIEDLRNNL
jgi:tetratricopeptide (TPR) repeat protein